jgi:serine/threonine-protein kinase
MMTSTDSLVDSIRQCRLLEPGRLNELTSDLLARFSDPRALARELIQRDWLTPFQLNQLALGRGPLLVFGPYVLLERLGKGGMGRVFKARHQESGRILALKILRRRFVSHPLALERFRRESQAVAQMSHPNIVQALETGQVAATPFLAMEYVEGTDLHLLVDKGGPLAIPLACAYAHQAALGLEHAHSRGVIHRDIKPRNLLIATPGVGPRSAAGVLKILDFGLALLEWETAGTNRLTQLGRRVGTVEYMAPEQEASCRDADARCDIYSLGCSLYYALAGRPPFLESERAGSIYPEVSWEAPPVQCFRPDVPPGLSDVLATMLARDPDRRYQTAAAVAATLVPFVQATNHARTSDWESVDAPVPLPITSSARPQGVEVAPEPAAMTAYDFYMRRRRRRRALVFGGAGGCLVLGLVLLIMLDPFSKLASHNANDAPKSDDGPGKTIEKPAPHLDRSPRKVKKPEEEEDPLPEKKDSKEKKARPKPEEVEDADS